MPPGSYDKPQGGDDRDEAPSRQQEKGVLQECQQIRDDDEARSRQQEIVVLHECQQIRDELHALLAATTNGNGVQSIGTSCTSLEIENGKQEEEEEDDSDSSPGRLPMDTYSLLAFVPPRSMAFVVAVLVFLIQIIALVLLLLDFTNGSDPKNRLSMPVYVTWPLRIAQLFGIVMAAVSGRDVVDSLFILQNGYDEDNLRRVLTDHFDSAPEGVYQPPRRLKKRWYASIALRLLQGLFNLGCTFLLIMRSTDVRVVMLSYGAVAFVSNIDQMAFQLVALGFFGAKSVHHARCKILTSLASVGDENRDKWRGGKKCRITTMASVCIFLVLLVCWGALAQRQSTGQFLPTQIYVQFGAEPSQTLYLYSGVYDLHMKTLNFFPTTGAVIYEEREIEGGSTRSSASRGKAHFLYCDKEGAWTFFPEEPQQGSIRQHPCDNKWVARSSRVDSYNILSSASVEWSVQVEDRHSGQSARSVMWDFRMMKNEECKDGERYGPLCELSAPCDEIIIGSDVFVLPAEQQSNFQLHAIDRTEKGPVWRSYNATLDDIDEVAKPTDYTHYKLLRRGTPSEGLVLVYDRPVYYARVGSLLNQTNSSVYSLIISSGRNYARALFVIEEVEASAEESLISDTALSFQEFLKHGWRKECGYDEYLQSWTCGYGDIQALFERSVTHATDRYILLNPDTDTGSPVAMPWLVILGDFSLYVPGHFLCAERVHNNII